MENYDVLNSNTTTLGSCIATVCNPSANLADNKLTGYGYDSAGNITTDAEGRTFTYDAENRQLTATGTNLATSYAYDGNGKRVKSHNSITNQTTYFIYDAEGDLSAEYNVNVPPPDFPTISYLTNDALGSPRVIGNAYGDLKARRDFFPFGDEIYAGYGSRTTSQRYSATSDDTRQKFATYQRDIETGLDFAQSRYFSPKHGRFTSPDEFKGGPDELFDFEEDARSNPTFYADLENPQSLNKYQYTYNNPYKYNDPNGHCPGRLLQLTLCHPAVQQRLIAASNAITRAGTAAVEWVSRQAGKMRRSVTNALGHLIRVDEPTTGSDPLGPVSTPNQPTYYEYDTLNNLTKVKQGGTFENPQQQRSFTYDALSRLQSASNPESGTINYVYDNNGNLTQKTDARGVQTAFIYDALNRVKQRNYSAPSGLANYQTAPDVTYFYDAVTNAKGKLTKVTSSVSTTEYTSFDILGRVTGHKQTTDGNDYNTAYAYNLSGALIEETYPSGRKVQNVLDNNGDLSMVKSRKNMLAGYWNYASNFTYSAAGAVTSMRLGNGKWESTVFNSRLQPTQIALGTTQNATNLLKLDYAYGAAANNGNILSQTITVPNSPGQADGFTANQIYTYDSLNRIHDATETVTGVSGNTWKQTFVYDRYGNRRFDFTNGNTTFPLSNCVEAVCNPTISTSNNQLTSTGWQYDAAGNTKTDAQGKTFTYDGENKQVLVKNSSNVAIGQYFYDGDGKRVKKVRPDTGETTIFVYDAVGKLIAEYSTNVASIENAKVAYLTNDHLGSPRINTDRDGRVISRHDYHPFGEEIVTSQRASNPEYTPDTVRKQFTGYERDSETGLDFAAARMYAKGIGRFQGADPYNIIFQKEKGKNARERKKILNNYILNPQVWNRYAYVLNNPLAMIDKSGNCSVPTGLQPGQTGICVEAYIKSRVLCKLGCLIGGFGDGRGRSGTDATLSNRVQTDIIVTRNNDGSVNVAATTKVNFSVAFQAIVAFPAALILPPAQGTATTEITNVVAGSDGSVRFTLSVTAANGYTANGLPGPSDIQFEYNVLVTPEGKVEYEGGAAKTYPTIDIWGYTMDDNGHAPAQDVRNFPEKDPSDLEKPKVAVPASTPQ